MLRVDHLDGVDLMQVIIQVMVVEVVPLVVQLQQLVLVMVVQE
jgi:hypothetical protein